MNSILLTHLESLSNEFMGGILALALKLRNIGTNPLLAYET